MDINNKKEITIGKCLGENCPNHCCTKKFRGLSDSLKGRDIYEFVQIKLSEEEVANIQKAGKQELLENKNGEYYLKLNDDYSCQAYKDGKCSIYEIRPDVCKLYPYYFDPFCGICIDKNCPGKFDLNVPNEYVYQLLNNRINLFNNSTSFSSDGINDFGKKIIMSKKIVAGGLIEKDGKYLLVQETKEKCKGMWNIPAGGVDDNENVVDAAIREVFEETGCKVKINGILEIVNKNLENVNIINFVFDAELIEENIQIDGKEISDVKWFTYEEILNMKDNLRAGGYFITAINNKKENKVAPVDLIKIENN